ncbi:hypothetical protein L210DRAFT_869988, partial [Boletus edulis BED1]
LKKFGATKGAWAVVTGASDGIGKEFALQLAAAGFNILLVARNEVALTSVAADIGIRMAGKVETRIQLVDFAKTIPRRSMHSLHSVVSGLDIGILMNNVGKSHAMPSCFVETAEQEIEDIVTINVQGTACCASWYDRTVCHFPFLHVQVTLTRELNVESGLILKVGSLAGQVASPILSTYSDGHNLQGADSLLAVSCKR